MSRDKPEPAAEFTRLLQTYHTASLATVSADGVPLASYVPVALDEDRSCLFLVSDVAEHAANRKAAPRASLLLVEDESKTEQLFARTRATFNGAVQHVGRESEAWTSASLRYRDRFGKFFDLLSGLPDFHLFRLTPDDVRLVIGFGAAYQVTGSQWETLTLLTGR